MASDMHAEQRRLHYLRAIGLDAWTNREPILDSSLAIQSDEQTPNQVQTDESAKALVSRVGNTGEVHSDVSSRSPVPGTAQDLLDKIATRVSACRACELHAHRKNTVFGVGRPGVNWMFIGEAPGAQEDKLGEPFVGRAGQLLNAILQALGMTRDEVYIANVLKCRPPGNRDPMGEEVRRCEPYLLEQIDAVQPKIVIAMGRFAAQSLLRSTEPIGKLRGKLHRYDAKDLPLIVTYHPAYLLRNPVDKRKVWDDLLFARNALAQGSQ